MYEAETFIVKRFRSLNSNKEITDKHLDLKVQELESFFGIRYNTCQLEAIKKAVPNVEIEFIPHSELKKDLKSSKELYKRFFNHYRWSWYW